MVDIAGLVKGASEGQGLGNAFLSHIKACDALFHMCSKQKFLLFLSKIAKVKNSRAVLSDGVSILHLVNMICRIDSLYSLIGKS